MADEIENLSYKPPPPYIVAAPPMATHFTNQPVGQVQFIQQPMFQQPQPIQLIQVQPMYRPPHIVPDVTGIRDYLVWSIINIFLGWIIIGFLPLIFSLICRSHKRVHNVDSARTMGTLALVFNILITLGGIIG